MTHALNVLRTIHSKYMQFASAVMCPNWAEEWADWAPWGAGKGVETPLPDDEIPAVAGIPTIRLKKENHGKGGRRSHGGAVARCRKSGKNGHMERGEEVIEAPLPDAENLAKNRHHTVQCWNFITICGGLGTELE